MDALTLESEFLRPLVSAWSNKLEEAERSRKHWREIAEECEMFYSKSAAAMWDPSYERKFWKGVKAPRFRITINKAYEYVAVYLPNLLWEVPYRTVEPKAHLKLPDSILQSSPEVAQMVEQMMGMQLEAETGADIRAYLMESWLNYTPEETPGGGLEKQSSLAIQDALLTGRGCLVNRTYQKDGTGPVLTGAFHLSPYELLIDPDCRHFQDASWIAIRHEDWHWAVERKFSLKEGSLKNKASLESIWSASELKTEDSQGSYRAAGMTNDKVVWFEIYSNMGPGARLTNMESTTRDHLEKVVGDHAYIAICPSCPYPLNCSSEKIRRGASDEDVKADFAWPAPLYKESRWPVEVLDFYDNQSSPWPVAPMAPGLGELKLLNFMIPWAANRIWSSSRDFWAVAGQHVEHYRQYLLDGEDQCIMPTPSGTDDVRKVLSQITQAETRQDIWRIIEMVSEMFDKRTGLTETAFGRNENGTQSRTAEETISKNRAIGVRPEYMQKKVVSFESRVAATEAFMARWFVTDVSSVLGPTGQWLWEQYVMSSDIENATSQMSYSVAAASIRRPNRERDISNYQNVMQLFVPTAMQYGFQTGDFSAYNFMMNKWAEYHDADLQGANLGALPPPMPPQAPAEEGQEMQQDPMAIQQAPPQMDPMAQQMAPPMQPGMDPMQQQLPPELMALLGGMQPQQPTPFPMMMGQ